MMLDHSSVSFCVKVKFGFEFIKNLLFMQNVIKRVIVV